MRTRLDPAQIAAYRRDGFTVIRDFLDPGELAALEDAVARAVRGLGRRKVAGGSLDNREEGDGYYDRVFLQRLNLWKVDDHIRSIFTAPALGRMLCELEGIDGIRVWHDQTLQKAPWANPTSYHLDNPYWSFSSEHAISIWIALDETTVQNGCLSYLPGSHRICTWERNVAIGPEFGSLMKTYPELAGTPPVAVPMRPGDAGLHNGLTAHGAGPNNSPRWRRAMTCAYMPDGATFNGERNVLPEELLAKLEVGDVLDDPAQNPLAWSRRGVAEGAS